MTRVGVGFREWLGCGVELQDGGHSLVMGRLPGRVLGLLSGWVLENWSDFGVRDVVWFRGIGF